MLPVILASTSPFRAQLLKQIHVPFQKAAPVCDEYQLPGERPAHMALRLAYEKAVSLKDDFPDHILIGSDQTASWDQTHVIGKPGSAARAAEQLRQQSGRSVMFHTGLCVYNSRSGIFHQDLVTTEVKFRHLSDETIMNYLSREDCTGCAGSFRSEGVGILLTESVRSEDASALVGLPLIRLSEFLRMMGVDPLA